jgi:uncharacterized membrane protein HdeD (DUF308 family)
MKKQLTIYLYGISIIICGLFILVSKNGDFDFIMNSLGITLLAGALLAFVSAFARQRKQVQFAYHEMHAIAMMVYGICILLFCSNFEKLIYFTNFLFIFYAFSEIIFCSWLFNLDQKIDFKILIIRVILGFSVGIGTIVALNYSDFTLTIFGAIFIAIGINILLYAPVMKGNQLNYNFKSMFEGEF